MENKAGVKYDQGKSDLSLLSYDASSQIAKAFEFGAKKYGRYNYLNGMEWTRIGSALARHVGAWVWGEDTDSESGLHHLAHAGACVYMLLDYVLKDLGTDNRYKKNVDTVEVVGFCNDMIHVGDSVVCIEPHGNLILHKEYKIITIEDGLGSIGPFVTVTDSPYRHYMSRFRKITKG